MRRTNLSFILVTLILFQSCVIYQKQAISLDAAIGKGHVKLISVSGTKYEFKNIEVSDSVYYGSGREYLSDSIFIKGKFLRTRLDSIQVSEVYLKNRQKSISRSTMLIVAGTATVFLLGVLVYSSFNLVSD